MRISVEADAAEVTRLARELALEAGLPATEAVHLATAVSEIAVNQLRHAGGGTIVLRSEPDAVRVEAADDGPGIADPELALTDGWSTGTSLGLGLPGARRLVDEFDLEAAPGGGTVVRMAKFRPGSGIALDPRRLAQWEVAAAPGSPFAAWVQRTETGFVAAVAPRRALDALRTNPGAAPPRLVELCGGRDAAVAVFEGRDGRLTWQAEPGASGALRRRRGERVADIGRAPRRRCATLAVLRGDEIVLTSFPLHDAGAASATELLSAVPTPAPAPTVLVVRLRRGALERRTSAGPAQGRG